MPSLIPVILRSHNSDYEVHYIVCVCEHRNNDADGLTDTFWVQSVAYGTVCLFLSASSRYVLFRFQMLTCTE